MFKAVVKIFLVGLLACALLIVCILSKYAANTIALRQSGVAKLINVCVYVPKEALEVVMAAMFEAGAGNIGEYKKCAFYSTGIGQFVPLKNSNPYSGNKHELYSAEEFKLEIVVNEDKFDAVIQAMYDAHPHEEPLWLAFRSLESKIKSRAQLNLEQNGK